MQFKFCVWRNICASYLDVDSNWCVLVTCLQISHLGLLQGPQKPSSVLTGGTLALTGMSFKLFPFLKRIIGIFSKTLLCSISGVRRRWIFHKILSFEKNKTIRNINTNLFQWTSSLWLYKSSVLLYFLSFKICCLTNFSVKPQPYLKESESLTVRYGFIWVIYMARCCMKVLMGVSGFGKWLSSLIISTFKKSIYSLEYFEVNLMLGW